MLGHIGIVPVATFPELSGKPTSDGITLLSLKAHCLLSLAMTCVRTVCFEVLSMNFNLIEILAYISK